jgi:hypothetical protein
MPNSMTDKNSNHTTTGGGEGFPILRIEFPIHHIGIAYMLLQNIRTILTKRAISWSALFTRLKAMNSAFIGKPCSMGNFVKMAGDGE